MAQFFKKYITHYEELLRVWIMLKNRKISLAEGDQQPEWPNNRTNIEYFHALCFVNCLR